MGSKSRGITAIGGVVSSKSKRSVEIRGWEKNIFSRLIKRGLSTLFPSNKEGIRGFYSRQEHAEFVEERAIQEAKNSLYMNRF